MASNIVPGNIDGTYPTAGQDNSSQGMRDNFNAIKNNFTETKTEIEDLQSNKASLNANNDFSGNIVSDAELKDNSETVFAHGTTGGAITLDHEKGHYQTLLNFPGGRFHAIEQNRRRYGLRAHYTQTENHNRF